MGLLAAAAEVARIPAIKGKAATGLSDFARLVGELRRLTEDTPDEVIRQVIDRSGYRRMLQESGDPDDQERLANIEELITAAKQFAAEDSSRTIADFLENITLASDVDGWDDVQDCVSVMTLHAAKGLEFPVVYMLAVEQGLLPHERSQYEQEELEEERRLAFVGMTRAKQELYLCHARVRDFRGRSMYAVPSMFLEELPAEAIEAIDLSASAGGTPRAIEEWRTGSPASEAGWADAGVRPRRRDPEPAPAQATVRAPLAVSDTTATGAGADYAVGMLVRHLTYGVGKITSVSGAGAQRKVKIQFRGHGEKTFVAGMAKLTIVQP
jgi:DNA helicase-2/ATP-dependent DNA helicase PcrA